MGRPRRVTRSRLDKDKQSELCEETPKSTKKSLRVLLQAYKKKREKKGGNYVYPRTVEAAQDPFMNKTGKNKMFFVIACNLYPDSMIIQPTDSEDSEEEETELTVELTKRLYGPGSSVTAVRRKLYSSAPEPESVEKVPRRRRRRGRRVGYGKASQIDPSWRTQFRRQVPGRGYSRRSVLGHAEMNEAIEAVVENYGKLKAPIFNYQNVTRPRERITLEKDTDIEILN